jgi:type II secretory pathway pseudopilin PulG
LDIPEERAMTMSRLGFTLVELLVVVAIIILLLALLAPALDRAMYQAELASCAATQRVLAMGAINYAFDNKRFYPDARGDGSNGTAHWRLNSMTLYVGGSANHVDPRPGMNFDLRPYYIPRPGARGAQYLPSMKAFVDPVTQAIDVGYEANDPDCGIASDYHLNAGWGPAGTGHMTKLGRGFTWSESRVSANGDPVEREIHVLVSDKNEVELNTRIPRGSSHPDDLGVMVFGFRQNAENPNQSAQDRALDLWPKKTFSGFGNPNGSLRHGGLAVNYGYDDGSVRRYDNVLTTDDRFFLVPHENAIPGTGVNPLFPGDTRRTMVPTSN